LEAAQCGAAVTVVDEASQAGGQLTKQIHKFFGPLEFFAGVRGMEAAKRMTAQCEARGVRLLLGAAAIGVWSPCVVGVTRAEQTWLMRPRYLLLATGANENALAFPGWTLPGVMTAGAAQTLMNLHRVLPGRRVVVVGAGNVGLIVAFQLLQAGAEVPAIVEIAPRPGGYFVHAARLARLHVPLLVRHTIVRCEGETEVEKAIVAQTDA